MKITKSIFILLTFSSLLLSCDKDIMNDEKDKKTPGSFNLTQVSSKKRADSNLIKKSSLMGFDFGEVKASKEFYFLLSNSGDEPIFDIKLSTDVSSFSIIPTSVDYLSGGEESVGIIPMLTLGVTHGINLNGVGYSDLLLDGKNTSTLEVKGKTLDSGDTTEVFSRFDVSVFAKVMDVEIYENDSKIDLTSNNGSLGTNLGGLGFMRMYIIDQTSSFSVKNIGNTKIDLYYGNDDNQTQMVTLNQSDSTTIDLTNDLNVIVLDSKGTITDNSRIQLGNDGKGYIAIMKQRN